VDKQQQLGGMCVELEAANSKENSRQLFQIVKSVTRRFQLEMIRVKTEAEIADEQAGFR